MNRALLLAGGLVALAASPAFARGVSPYLPLQTDPVAEQQIEALLILADKPVLTRPIAAATVLDALPVACQRDPVLCQEVRKYLARYMRNWSVTDASAEISASSGADKTLPNRYGLTADSDWNVAVRGFWQPLDHALISVGAVAYEGEAVPEGSMISLGWDRAQLDLGYRAHWFSPFTDSSMLIGTQGATMPGVTLSNYLPLTRWGLHYEAFVASMSSSDHIVFNNTTESGRPRLSGVHLSAEPAAGWAIGVNRLLQYGGGDRPGSFSNLIHAFFNPSAYDNTSATLTSDQQFGNQVASITSEMIFPGRVPFSVYFEYAGEDTSAGKNYLLGNASLSAGLHFPRLWRDFDLTVELSEWQNGWYVNSVYLDGLTNKGHVIGHWGGDERKFGDAVGARSGMVRLTWNASFGGTFDARLRALQNEDYYGTNYRSAYDATVRYERPVNMFSIGAEVYAGRNVFGENFSRVGAFFRLNDARGPQGSRHTGGADMPWVGDKSAELFVEAGAARNRLRIDLDATSPFTRSSVGAHLGVGARRAVSDRSDLGARLELDDVDGHDLISVRAIDYRYRFANPLAFSLFLGASRYDLATPAYGLYYGVGLQWRNLAPGWDIGLDLRSAKKIARDHLLPNDPSSALRPDSFYTLTGTTLAVSKRF
jgi:Capsule assembly protein Wzi